MFRLGSDTSLDCESAHGETVIYLDMDMFIYILSSRMIKMNHDKLQILLNDKILNKAEHITDEEKHKRMCKMHAYHKAHEKYEDVMIAIEEMAELIQVLSKIKRGKMKSSDISIMEEIADVRLCMDEIANYVFDTSTESLDVISRKQIIKEENDS